MSKIASIVVVLALIAPIAASAAFSRDLAYGMQVDPEVQELQEFLTDRGFYTGPITGNFFSLTLAGVKKFQTAYGIIPVSGYFGPKSRAQANEILAEAGITDSAVINESGSASPIQSSNQLSAIAELIRQISELQKQIAQLQMIATQPKNEKPATITPKEPESPKMSTPQITATDAPGPIPEAQESKDALIGRIIQTQNRKLWEENLNKFDAADLERIRQKTGFIRLPAVRVLPTVRLDSSSPARPRIDKVALGNSILVVFKISDHDDGDQYYVGGFKYEIISDTFAAGELPIRIWDGSSSVQDEAWPAGRSAIVKGGSRIFSIRVEPTDLRKTGTFRIKISGASSYSANEAADGQPIDLSPGAGNKRFDIAGLPIISDEITVYDSSSTSTSQPKN